MVVMISVFLLVMNAAMLLSNIIYHANNLRYNDILQEYYQQITTYHQELHAVVEGASTDVWGYYNES